MEEKVDFKERVSISKVPTAHKASRQQTWSGARYLPWEMRGRDSCTHHMLALIRSKRHRCWKQRQMKTHHLKNAIRDV